MFTGLIEATGRILDLEQVGDDARIRLLAPSLDTSRVEQGDSIAVSGVCLTVTAKQDHVIDMDISAETLARTTLGGLASGDEVNLETALTPTSKLGGHLVTGHVDGVGAIVEGEDIGASVRLALSAPGALARYIADKGSICVDGVSLTVNEVHGSSFKVNIIPHTLRVTTLRLWRPGMRVNLEVDLIARYLERLLLGGRAADAGAKGITSEFLRRCGFMDNDLSDPEAG
jgi:riboflavin synthase